MPEIQLPVSDAARTFLLDRLFTTLSALAPADRPIPADTYDGLVAARTAWAPVATEYRAATSAQRGDVGRLTPARAKALLFVSHYLQVFNLAIRRGVYEPADRALFGLPVDSADLPPLYADQLLTSALTSIAQGNAVLAAGGRPAMTNPTAAEVAAAGTAYQTLLQTRASRGEDTVAASTGVEKLRPVVDEALADVYAELKHRHRKLTPAQWRTIGRTYGFRFTNARDEKPEGRYTGPVAAGELVEVYEGVFGADLRVHLRNPGLTDWEIGLAPTDDALPAPVLVKAGAEVILKAADLGNLADRNLLIRNRSTDQLGEWDVTFEPAD